MSGGAQCGDESLPMMPDFVFAPFSSAVTIGKVILQCGIWHCCTAAYFLNIRKLFLYCEIQIKDH
jgi:hypothetical protein